MAKDFTVSINNPQRRLEWLDMLDAACLHVKSVIPELAMMPGFDEPQPVYYVDLDCLTPQQRQRLTRHLSARLSLSVEQVERQLETENIPILALDCVLMVRNPHKWLG
jgi:hypothetical protein